jgi:Tannase and feruloyl esterase
MMKMINLILCILSLPFWLCFAAAIPCSSIGNIEVPGAQVLSITSIIRTNLTVATHSNEAASSVINICDVTLVLTHPGANDTVTVEIWLPIAGWNGRFQGTGGGGFAVGYGPSRLGPAVAGGYSAGSTDGGNLGTALTLSREALVNGEVNWALVLNYAYRSVHDMAIVGKAVTQRYYGKPAEYSYFTGCSNGGREGYVSAQMYPGDFNGILALSPAINGLENLMSMQWPYVVMHEEANVPSQCLFQAFVNASIALCDHLDGVEDGIISNVDACHFNPSTLVGHQVFCDGTSIIIDHATANVFSKIYNGPAAPNGTKLWFGLNPGTGFNGMQRHSQSYDVTHVDLLLPFSTCS